MIKAQNRGFIIRSSKVRKFNRNSNKRDIKRIVKDAAKFDARLNSDEGKDNKK